MEQPIILFYNLANSKGNKIEKLCRRLSIEVKQVTGSDYKETIGYLAGVSERMETEPDSSIKAEEDSFIELLEEMFIMANFPEKLLDNFLKEYKKMHIEPVGLKAILTSRNKTWNSFQLYNELRREREAISQP